MISHDLKTWPEPFQAMWDGKKLFELRKNDRSFRVGDNLRLREWLPSTRTYTGRCIQAEVTYILEGGFGLPTEYVILSLNPRMAFTQPSISFKAVKEDP